MASSKVTLFFFIAAIVALASAIPAPASNNAPAAPQPIEPQESKVESEQLEAGEEEKDLKASQSIGYGYYGYPYSSGYYGGYYPYSYSTYYGGYPYSYGYRGFGGLYGWY